MPASNQERQRRAVEKRKARIALMPKIPCACGCGTLIAPIDARLKPLRYVRGHQNRVNPSPLQGKPAYNRIGDAPLSGAEKTKRYREQRFAEIALMPKIPCACGCGTLIAPINKKLQPATYVKEHTSRRAMNPHWRGGTSPLRYGHGFTAKLKRLILKRDNWTCQRCGIAQDTHGKVLQVHHLDHNTMNNDPANLVAACQKCNMWASYHRDEPFKS